MSSKQKLRSGAIFAACAVLFLSAPAVSARPILGEPSAQGDPPAEPTDGPSTGNTPKLTIRGGQYHGPLDNVPQKGGFATGGRPPERTPPKPAVSKPKGELGKRPGGSAGPKGAGARSATRGVDGYGGKRGARTNADESWERWWEQNGYRFAEMRFESEEPITLAGSTTFLTGHGENPLPERARFSDELIRTQVLPAFEAVLRTRDLELLEASVIPYAQCVPLTDSSRAVAALAPLLEIPSRALQAKTLLALGLTRSRLALPILSGVLFDQKNGRTALAAASTIPDELRGMAAIALGYLRDPETLRILEQVIFETRKSAIETRAMAVRALGEYVAQRDAATEILLDVLRDTKLGDEIRAQAPLALRRLGAGRAVPALAKASASDELSIRLEESCLIALGDLASPLDATLVSQLRDRARNDPNAQLRGFALIALAEIAERAVRLEPQAYRGFTAEIAVFLTTEVEKPSRIGNSPWASLAAAIAARSLESFDPVRDEAIAAITRRFSEEANSGHRGALALSLALLGCQEQASELLNEMNRADDPRLVGYLALALGMLDHREARPELQQLMLHNDPAVARQAAGALALLGETDLSTALTDAMATSRNLGQLHSLAHAVGLLGDRAAVERISKWIGNSTVAKAARAEGCVALGILGQRLGKSLRRDLIGDVNYRSESTALQRLLELDV